MESSVASSVRLSSMTRKRSLWLLQWPSQLRRPGSWGLAPRKGHTRCWWTTPSSQVVERQAARERQRHGGPSRMGQHLDCCFAAGVAVQHGTAPSVVQRGRCGAAPTRQRRPCLRHTQGGVCGRAWRSNARAAATVGHGAHPRDGGLADAAVAPGGAAVRGGAGRVAHAAGGPPRQRLDSALGCRACCVCGVRPEARWDVAHLLRLQWPQHHHAPGGGAASAHRQAV
jgi:hypothetical protein